MTNDPIRAEVDAAAAPVANDLLRHQRAAGSAIASFSVTHAV
jgi:hypothetical protein